MPTVRIPIPINGKQASVGIYKHGNGEIALSVQNSIGGHSSWVDLNRKQVAEIIAALVKTLE